MKPLDFVKTKKGNIGMIVEVSTSGETLKASIQFLEKQVYEKFAWWYPNEFDIISNLPDLLSQGLKNPAGSGSLQPFK